MKLTIITINYNNAPGLRKTLESIKAQTSNAFEYIVIDGNSTDGSVEIIQDYEFLISKWVSEPDQGIYDAMNKGVSMATGDYVMFLNSGDWLHDSNIIKDLNNQSFDADIIFGKVLNIAPNGKTGIFESPDEITMMTLVHETVNHAGALIRTDLQRKFPYRSDLRICSDRQFFMEALVFYNCSYKKLDRIICDFDMTGIGNSNGELLFEEVENIKSTLLPPRVLADYNATNVQLQNVTSELVKYRGFSNIICKLNHKLIKLYKLLHR